MGSLYAPKMRALSELGFSCKYEIFSFDKLNPACLKPHLEE
ncbi:hypothetical protein HMPREF1321_1847 [Capnocytophaga sp. oral taxon 412 str. F0487]|nr:hypothetical protein HMPREF1321_1847 [Capnocytophaga sp. oral taxon 412 str. F0487]